ncbi:hypothetical protein SAMN02745245_01847 [Anaerosphaera aminiphila DSM 21120]|uniref:CAAX prenyl protease 2/Lysostaphin resistance protein A-like domain-containing protein n=1 Tax=Anaerosphaera aminiphila DSM 21120 TaxID=1120995 RepID=A0A1M5UQC7_9FIRM|nr:type II CAAX endopeptidase family protein [Anaerosphaera aminiphila]SHH65282.1 hypothetical protein SAMN02745245_01847 [Anaerosphaera aminiphila DSM 21120]
MSEELIESSDYTDFPFKDTSNLKWFFSIVVLLFGFSVTFLSTLISNIVVLLVFFMGTCFLSLFILDRHFFKKIFRPLKSKDLSSIITTLILTYVVAIFILSNVNIEMNENPIVDLITKDNILIIFITSIVQLLGEEILFVVPFLFVFNKFEAKSNRNIAILVAWIVSSLFFGILHLPTYSYNLVQSLVVIGGVRFILSLSYIWTKNLTVTYIVHVLYDWIIIFLSVFLI